MLSDIKALIGLIGDLLGKGRRASQSYREARDRDKQAAVRWIVAVRECVLKLRDCLEQRRDPTRATAELAAYTWNNRLPGTVRKLLGEANTRRLQTILRDLNHRAREADPPGATTKRERDALLRQLDRAAGQLTALANLAEAG
jgi:hypothetical protein